jgi:predicted Rossmann-fold nucleotide-binding protein
MGANKGCWLRNPVLARGFISEGDFDLVRICDHPDEVIEAIQRWYSKHEVTGRKALLK